MTGPPRLSLIVMVFNEVETLRSVVLDAIEEVRALRISHEVVIVDDGSTDGTTAVAETLMSENPCIRVVRHATNLGLGQVYRTGFMEARGELVTFFPADGQFPAGNLSRLYQATGDHDMVLGYLAERSDGAISALLSLGERAVYWVALGRIPRFQGLLMFRRVLLDQIPLTSSGRGWGVLMELVLQTARGNYKVRNVLTEVRPRTSGRSKVRNVRTVVANLRQIMELGHRLGRARDTARS